MKEIYFNLNTQLNKKFIINYLLIITTIIIFIGCNGCVRTKHFSSENDLLYKNSNSSDSVNIENSNVKKKKNNLLKNDAAFSFVASVRCCLGFGKVCFQIISF